MRAQIALIARDVGVEIWGTVVQRPTSLTVRRGEVVAVTGPSGSGKTTLLGCVSGTVVPTHGSAVVEGNEISALSAAARARFRRRSVGVVFQDPELLDELSVVENVALSLIFNGVERKQALRRAFQTLEAVGVEPLAEARTATLSGGEAQRVALARALVKAAPLVVADEPTASLDAANALQVAELLVGAARNFATAVLLATHDPAIADRCDDVVALREAPAIAR